MRLAYSIDLDDAFMFWALASGKLDGDFQHERADTATLNAWAREGSRDVIAVSIANWPFIADKYLMLPHGGSVGRSYGPVIVSPHTRDPKTIGIPGPQTTCDILVALYAPAARRVFIPMERSFEALERGEVDACALIHEGRLTYASRGLHLLQDLGVWWQQKRNLPLPLGGNVIRRDLGPDLMRTVSRMLHASIAHALSHRAEAVEYAQQFGRGLDRKDTDTFVGMYVNQLTLDYGPRGRAGLERFFKEAYEKQLIPKPVPVEFVQ
jgi:1,4-dihydroxy-6-naphthoate synthase